MSESNLPATYAGITLPTISNTLANALKARESVSFLPRITLLYPGSGPCVEEPEGSNATPRAGDFWLNPNISLGQEFDCVCLATRDHATLMSENSSEGLLSESFNADDKEFQHIQEVDRKVRDAKKKRKPLPTENRPRWGGDALLWIPQYGKFGTYFMYGREQVQKLVFTFAVNRGKPLRVKTKRDKTKQGFYLYTPVLANSKEDLELPSEDQVLSALQMFQGEVIGDATKPR